MPHRLLILKVSAKSDYRLVSYLANEPMWLTGLSSPLAEIKVKHSHKITFQQLKSLLVNLFIQPSCWYFKTVFGTFQEWKTPNFRFFQNSKMHFQDFAGAIFAYNVSTKCSQRYFCYNLKTIHKLPSKLAGNCSNECWCVKTTHFTWRMYTNYLVMLRETEPWQKYYIFHIAFRKKPLKV